MRTAIYPGSFDPLTNGHLDIIKRSAKIFDEVVVAVSVNSKKNPLFTLEERVAMISEVVSELPNVRADVVDGLLVDYVAKFENGVIVKGLRALSDFEYEFQMALLNRDISDKIETMFLMTNVKYAFLSSSIVKEIDYYGVDIEKYAPPVIVKAMQAKKGK